MRLAVYTDYTYRRGAGRVYTERAFGLFLGRLADELDELVLLGKIDPEDGPLRYAMPDGVRLVELPYFRSLADPLQVGLVMLRSPAIIWRALDGVDAIWLLGPNPLALPMALLAWLRRRRVVLGIRQDLPRYVRSRHPRRRLLHRLADTLEWLWRMLARRTRLVAVGPALAAGYPGARVLPIMVSLVREADIASTVAAPAQDGGVRRVLSVGRLEEEKNPLLLAEILAQLARDGSDWRLEVCGEGPLTEALLARARELGVEGRLRLLGYVPHDELRQVYERADALLHVSWTEGVPQVLFEAFAAALPVVATDVGGVAAAASGAALLIPPGDAGAAAQALTRVWSEPGLAQRLVARGTEVVREHTLDAEARRVAAFLAAP